MKFITLISLLLLSLATWAQGGPVKHPRVAEVEEKMRDEASRYFTRRFPNEPFFIKVEVNPLRRDMVSGQKMENLPYFDYESEESVDEWDDPKTPMSFLRHRVTKVVIELSVPDAFDEVRIAEIKDEVTVYLKLLPFRDDVRVVKKFKAAKPPLITDEMYQLFGGLLISALVVGFLVRSGLSRMKPNTATSAPIAAPIAQASSSSANRERVTSHKGSTAVSGDVTFHDPMKTMDIVHLKHDQISKSGTFPTLSDMITLHAAGEKNPTRLGALLYEMPVEWQKKLFPLGIGQNWLEAFCDPGQIDHECLTLLDRIGKERSFSSGSREGEDLLIQLWRMGEKGIQFFKRIPQDHAFIILNMMPKSFALGIAKKAFPGAWGRLLENQTAQAVIDLSTMQFYQVQALTIEPPFEWRLLENYRKDRELLKYLDTVSIDDEKDVYDTLPEESFVLRVRPAFAQVFQLEGEVWKNFVGSYPLEKWALVVMNSSRSYNRQILDVLDDKQRAVFSQHLKNLDQGFALAEQAEWRRTIAQASVPLVSPVIQPMKAEEPQESEHAKSA
jgi:hypothetical protein